MLLRRVVILAALSAVAAAGCGSSSKGSSATATSTTPAPAATTPTTSSAPTSIAPADRSPAGKINAEPAVKVPTGPPPSQLETADLIVGNGQTASSGSSVAIQYVGASYSSGKVFDASWNRHQTLPFTLGQGEVIPGMDQGVAGMKVGGRREIIIPSSLAYGANPPAGSGIAANETLIFIVDLVSIG
jgi:peptidylprolyl isomerase